MEEPLPFALEVTVRSCSGRCSSLEGPGGFVLDGLQAPEAAIRGKRDSNGVLLAPRALGVALGITFSLLPGDGIPV